MIFRKEAERFTIVDDFLDRKNFELLWSFFQTTIFASVDLGGFKGHWRLDDGRVMRATDVYHYVTPGSAKVPQGAAAYPTQTGIDLLIKKFLENSERFKGLIGEAGKDWAFFVAAPRLYERGSGLYWHRDSPTSLTGSATFYAHPDWNIQWGGEMLIADEATAAIPDNYGPYMNPPQQVMGLKEPFAFPSHLDNSKTNELLMETANGYYCAPKPNRLVVMKTGTPHMVTKVDAAAGDRVRASITIFFYRPGIDRSGAY